MQPKLDTCPRCGSNDPDRVTDAACEIGGKGHNPYSTDRVLEYERYNEEQKARREEITGHVIYLAARLRNRIDTISPAMKDYYLKFIVQIADEFLGAR